MTISKDIIAYEAKLILGEERLSAIYIPVEEIRDGAKKLRMTYEGLPVYRGNDNEA